MEILKIEIERVGECRECGYCCPPLCPHFINENGLCAIQETKGEFCKICQQTHQECLDAPQFPMKKGNPNCGFSFLVKGTDLEVFEMLCTKIQPKDE